MGLWRRGAEAGRAEGTPGPSEAAPAALAERLLRRARAGDKQARDELIGRYRPFVLAVASRVLGRFVHPSDDEASVGLIAFNEAIDGFDPVRGGSFLGFAETVIRRRLIDHIRRDRRHGRAVPLSSLEREDEEGRPSDPLEDSGVDAAVPADVEAVERRDEIERYKRRLAEFGVSFAELPAACPRHADARASAIAVARVLASDPAYREYLLRTGNLPLRELEQDPRIRVSRKTLERQRKFIIAVAVILGEDFHGLREFIPEG